MPLLARTYGYTPDQVDAMTRRDLRILVEACLPNEGGGARGVAR